MLNFYSPEDAVSYDILLEAGYELKIMDHRESIVDYIVRIRGEMSAMYREGTFPYHQFVFWVYREGTFPYHQFVFWVLMGGNSRPEDRIYAIVRAGTTENLFSDIDGCTTWSWLMTRDELTAWFAIEALRR